MKKIIAIFAALLCFVVSHAQEGTDSSKTTSSNSSSSESKSLAVGIKGILLSTTSTPDILFRYYLSDASALRASISINPIRTNTNNLYIADDVARAADPLSQAFVVDKEKVSTNTMDFKLGYMMIKNFDRLNAFYGLDLGYGFSQSNSTYQYSNAITEANQTPSTANFGNNGSGAVRTLETVGGKTQNMNATLFLGVEYYLLPKLCIGAEAGLQYKYEWGSQSSKKTEQWQGSSIVNKDALVSPGNVMSEFKTTGYSGLFLLYHL